jgi:hypothetical protein
MDFVKTVVVFKIDSFVSWNLSSMVLMCLVGHDESALVLGRIAGRTTALPGNSKIVLEEKKETQQPECNYAHFS